MTCIRTNLDSDGLVTRSDVIIGCLFSTSSSVVDVYQKASFLLNDSSRSWMDWYSSEKASTSFTAQYLSLIHCRRPVRVLGPEFWHKRQQVSSTLAPSRLHYRQLVAHCNGTSMVDLVWSGAEFVLKSTSLITYGPGSFCTCNTRNG